MEELDHKCIPSSITSHPTQKIMKMNQHAKNILHYPILHRETLTHKYYNIKKYHPTFIVIANTCIWTHDSYSQYAPLSDLSTPEEHCAFPWWIPDERLRSIQKNPKYAECIKKYKKAAADINWGEKKSSASTTVTRRATQTNNSWKNQLNTGTEQQSTSLASPALNPTGLFQPSTSGIKGPQI